MAKNNVIHLPVGNRLLKIKNVLRKVISEQRQTLMITSIVTVLFAVALINDQVTNADGAMQAGRGLASVEKQGTSDFSLADSMVQELAQESLKSPATFAKRASALDQFAFGTLEGKYALEIFAGRIRGIQLADKGLTPTLIQDPAAFLKSATNFMEVPSFSKIQAVSEQEFALIDSQGRQVAKVQIELDYLSTPPILKIAR